MTAQVFLCLAGRDSRFGAASLPYLGSSMQAGGRIVHGG